MFLLRQQFLTWKIDAITLLTLRIFLFLLLILRDLQRTVWMLKINSIHCRIPSSNISNKEHYTINTGSVDGVPAENRTWGPIMAMLDFWRSETVVSLFYLIDWCGCTWDGVGSIWSSHKYSRWNRSYLPSTPNTLQQSSLGCQLLSGGSLGDGHLPIFHDK